MERQAIFTVPTDVSLDILKILFENDLLFEITGINEDQNAMVVKIQPQMDQGIFHKAVENIHGILRDYKNYQSGSPQNS